MTTANRIRLDDLKDSTLVDAMKAVRDLARERGMIIVASVCEAEPPGGMEDEWDLKILCGCASPIQDQLRERMARKCLEVLVERHFSLGKSRDDKVTEELLKP